VPEDPSVASPPVRTGLLWVILTLLALAGIACGILGYSSFASALGGQAVLLMTVLGALGTAGFLFFLYLTLGVLYRLDRLRHPLSRRFRIFE
jgi:hypothetical protein